MSGSQGDGWTCPRCRVVNLTTIVVCACGTLRARGSGHVQVPAFYRRPVVPEVPVRWLDLPKFVLARAIDKGITRWKFLMDVIE